MMGTMVYRYINFCIKSFWFFWILGAFIFFSFWGWGEGAEKDDVRLIAWLSLVWFSFFLAFSGLSERLFWQLAPFALFFTPNAVNDFWPSSPMADGEGMPFFSYFTHIDIYLCAGVLAYCDFRRRLSYKMVCVFFVFFIFVVTVFLGAIWRADFWRVLQGGYQIRYLFLFFILFLYANPLRYVEGFSGSLRLVFLLIVLEAFVFSVVNGELRLTSGNYGVNSLGHLLAAGVVFSIFQLGGMDRKIGCYALVLILAVGMVATSTRFSLVALMLAISMLCFLRWGRLSGLFPVFSILFCMFFIFFYFFPAGRSMWEGFLVLRDGIDDLDSILITPESSSMVTRLKLWWASLDMLQAHPWLGIGPGVWGFMKTDYGIEFDSVLDPHQDLLNYLVSYGLVFGGAIYFSVFIFPIIRVCKLRRVVAAPPWGWVGIVVVLLFAGATNAVTWKHQISALAYISAFMVIFWSTRFAGYHSQKNIAFRD